MNLTQAKSIAGTLGKPSKMPGTSYGLPAVTHCPVGGKLAKVVGSVCHGCYAAKGNYRFRDVKKSQHYRLAAIRHPDWVQAMAYQLNHAIAKGSPPYHRWHDGGDVQDLPHLEGIAAVASLTPEIQQWLPTRETGTVKAFLAKWGKFPSNLTVRISATMVDKGPPASHALTSTVSRHTAPVGFVCPAPTQGNACGECRACWSDEVANVSYHYH